MPIKPAVFLDRDGTINVDRNYVHRIEQWEWIPGAELSIKRLRDAGYLIIIVTNQAGIARGLYDAAKVRELHQFVNDDLGKVGTAIDRFYFCPHHPDFTGECECRKPKAGMLIQAAKELGIDFSRSWLVGDKLSDLRAAQAVGAKPILVKTGYGEKEALNAASGQLVVADIKAACDTILGQGLA